MGWRLNQTKIQKEKDWYFAFKHEEQQEKTEEYMYKQSLNPISLFIYQNIYTKCCKSKKKSKYDFSKKDN